MRNSEERWAMSGGLGRCNHGQTHGDPAVPRDWPEPSSGHLCASFPLFPPPKR